MILGRRNKHPLPKVPSNVRTTFKNMAKAIPEDKIAELSTLVEEAINKTREDAQQSNRIDLKTAEEVASRCRLLLEHYAEFSEPERALVIGAVRYFVVDDDPMSDDLFASGFDDDAKVINYVLEQLGIEGVYIELI